MNIIGRIRRIRRVETGSLAVWAAGTAETRTGRIGATKGTAGIGGFITRVDLNSIRQVLVKCEFWLGVVCEFYNELQNVQEEEVTRRRLICDLERNDRELEGKSR
jgi:hypothetical protein